MKHQVAILSQLIKTYQPSDKCIKLSTDNEFFDDSVRYCGLVHELFELKNTLENMIRYNKYIIESTGEE